MLKTKLRITIIVLIFFVGVFSVYSLQNYNFQDTKRAAPQVLSEVTNASPEIKIYDNGKGVFTVIFPDQNIKLIHNTELKTTQDLTDAYDFNYVINAGYFLEDKSHAGLLLLNSEIKVRLAQLEQQLSHVVTFDNSSIKFIAKEDFIGEGIQNAFQVGPLFIDRNRIREDLINNSINGRGRYLRSILGITESGKSFFIAFTRPRSLDEVYKYIIEIKDLKNEIISAINLDGGSSVAIFSLEDETFAFGSQKKLPFFLGWKKSDD